MYILSIVFPAAGAEPCLRHFASNTRKALFGDDMVRVLMPVANAWRLYRVGDGWCDGSPDAAMWIPSIPNKGYYIV